MFQKFVFTSPVLKAQVYPLEIADFLKQSRINECLEGKKNRKKRKERQRERERLLQIWILMWHQKRK